MADGFFWTRDLNGHPHPIIQECYIASGTAIEYGEPVTFTNGTGIAAHGGPADLDDPIFGVANEAHDGSTSGRQSGNWIEISVSPTAVYKHKCTKVYTLTGGSTGTAVDDSLLPQTDNYWIGGYIEIVSCAAASYLNGTRHLISDSTGADGTLTLANTLPAALAAADTIKICPGYMVRGPVVWDADSDFMNPDYDTDGGIGLVIVGSTPSKMELEVMFQQNMLSQHPYTV